jgi:hypothetical protein
MPHIRNINVVNHFEHNSLTAQFKIWCHCKTPLEEISFGRLVRTNGKRLTSESAGQGLMWRCFAVCNKQMQIIIKGIGWAGPRVSPDTVEKRTEPRSLVCPVWRQVTVPTELSRLHTSDKLCRLVFRNVSHRIAKSEELQTFFTFDTRWKWMVSFTILPFFPGNT